MIPPEPSNTILQLQEVTRTFGSGTNAFVALDRVTLGCRRGSWTAIMGPSGSGKSTLMSCAAGLDSPDAGRVFLNGSDISTLSDDNLTRLRRSDIGFVFQQFNLVGALTALQNVSLPLRLAGDSNADSTARDALGVLGLAEHIGQKPRELSGGQQQRVAIARALATQPSIVFADEPTGALDSAAAAVVLRLLRELVDRGQTILMVTHDPQAASRADHVAFLRDGRLVRTLDGADAAQIASALADLELAP
ncbi:ABC transporter [Rhodococcus sp. 14-2470-1b]|uniref:ABC transporter ATP-binding protein n=1 Tax=Nocardiaceae TaxID=85025 RepID=UPI000B9C3995|nr:MULTISPECIES: ABC transporter ATP-binding protein [Rhodococcus]MDJ0004843.1 ABC transporter ATP-binding protein [Rhodococcus fascians]OZF47718.1 ABC transporter [Rhodococcus sp. 14-2470-1b]